MWGGGGGCTAQTSSTITCTTMRVARVTRDYFLARMEIQKLQ